MKLWSSILLLSCLVVIVSGCALQLPGLVVGRKPEPIRPSTPLPNSQTLNQSSGQASNIPDRLKKLKELKESGAITEEEYQVQRKVLVDKL